MTRFRSVRSFAALAPILLSGFAGAQTQESQRVEVKLGAAPHVSRAEIVLDQYAVQNVSPVELFNLAKSLRGRGIVIEEEGAQRLNLMLLGNTIITYDTKAEVQRMRELLASLDAAPEAKQSNWKTVEYKPRFISLDTARTAIQDSISHVSPVQERSLVILQDHAEDVDAALALLKRIDVPERQVLLSCQLIDVVGAQQGPALPKELLDNLQKLLPQTQFTQVGTAMLKASVDGSEEISMEIESTGKRYRLSITPVAFDEGSATLTVTASMEEWANGELRPLFRTNTTLKSGEYTVLAASGTTPRLLVVRMIPQG